MTCPPRATPPAHQPMPATDQAEAWDSGSRRVGPIRPWTTPRGTRLPCSPRFSPCEKTSGEIFLPDCGLKNGSHKRMNLRHLCNICVPDWRDRLVLTMPRIIDVCDVCARREGSDYGNVQIRAFRDTPDLPKLGPIDA